MLDLADANKQQRPSSRPVFIVNKAKGQGCININANEKETKDTIAELFDISAKKYRKFIGFDYETNGLCPIINKPLLAGLGLPDAQIGIDCHGINIFDLFPDNWRDYTFVAHNAKFDYSFTDSHYGVHIPKMYDTMVASQKLLQNTKKRHSLPECLYRYLGIELESPKDTRLQFVGRNPEIHNLYTYTQLRYLCEDVQYLVPLKTAIDKVAEKYNLKRWLYSVELRLMQILGRAENRGIGMDFDGIQEILSKNEKKAFDLACQLDDELRTLSKGSQYFKGGIYSAKRNFYDPSAYQYDFTTGKTTEKGIAISTRAKKKPLKKAVANTANINWNSDTTVLKIFGLLKEPLLTKDEHYLIPLVRNNKVSRTTALAYIAGEYKEIFLPSSFQTNKKAFAKYLIDKPNTRCRKLINLLVEYSRVTHEINSFGYGYLRKKNPITGLVHTLYKQAATANSRFSSGAGGESEKGDKKEMSYRIQSQNIPRDNNIRNLLHSPQRDEGWMVATCDLSGAEVTIICDKAHDEKLYEWAVKNDDAHSPIVQNSWRYLFLYRAGYEAGQWINARDFFSKVKYGQIDKWADKILTINNKKAHELAKLAKTFIVSKQVNKPYRQGGKNNTFGSIYNMGKETAAATYNGTTAELRKVDPNAIPVNVTGEEASIALWAIKKAIPKTFSFVEEQSRKALKQGYLVLNNRSHSRVWFDNVLYIKSAINDTIKENARDGIKSYLSEIDLYNGEYILNTGEVFNLKWDEIKEIDGQARNLPISGTQADMIKEAMVVMDNIITKYSLQAHFMMQVHDELVYDYNPVMGNISYNLDNVTYTHKFPELLKNVMATVATKYLYHYEMHAEVEDKPFWTK